MSVILAGCSAFGASNVDIAPYKILKTAAQDNIEIRTYESMVLVSASMQAKNEKNDGRNNAFRTLFSYINGNNLGAQKIEMTAPVLIDEKKKGAKIPMTAPVFIDEDVDEPVMSFVMPASYTLGSTPKPKDENVRVSEIKNYKVAVIRFNGRLSDSNVNAHQKILENWIEKNGHEVVGAYKKAGYNAPFTLPVFRRNEVLIPIK